jgi:NAD(P)-dependent dehydrogenase (short-subunit alcohol dehydrogenase family)
MNDLRLSGKIVLVTGAADDRSIGWGIARALANEGADVAVNDVTHLEELEKRAGELRAMGRRSLAIPADVTQPDQVEAMIGRTASQLGRLDILCSNAGIIRWEPFLDITPKNLQAIVNVNILGNVNVCQAAARQMIAQGGGGRIIITSSVQSDIQFPITPVYGGTKAAMHIFVGCLALELAEHNITVNHIGPGYVESALNDVSPQLQTPEAIENQRRAVPLGHRAGTSYEMGRAAVYFASSDGDYVTGAFIRLDGGLALGK